eukprot:7872-Rhodomonas_salina.1
MQNGSQHICDQFAGEPVLKKLACLGGSAQKPRFRHRTAARGVAMGCHRTGKEPGTGWRSDKLRPLVPEPEPRQQHASVCTEAPPKGPRINMVAGLAGVDPNRILQCSTYSSLYLDIVHLPGYCQAKKYVAVTKTTTEFDRHQSLGHGMNLL